MFSATGVTSHGAAAPHALRRPPLKHSIFHSPFCMVAVGLTVRILCIALGRLYRLDTLQWTAFEMANVGRSLALNHGFSTPFYHGFGTPWDGFSGPTAWTAPFYPWMVSLVFRIFGIYSNGSAFVLLTFNSIFSALTSWTIYSIARRFSDARVAAWSGWIWAFFPYSVFWSVTWVWETSLSAFLLSLVFLLTLRMEGDTRLRSWFLYGAVWALIALTNTSILSWLPFAGCWLAYRLRVYNRRFLRPVLLGAVTFWALIAPWLVRNYVVFDKLIFIRGDLGSELRTGNNPLAEGSWVPEYRAANNQELYAEYKRLGEVAYDAEQGRLAKQWITEDPVRFLRLSCRKFEYFWLGLPVPPLLRLKQLLFLCLTFLPIGALLMASWRRVHGTFLFATLLACYPLVYYITFPTTRYRHTIEPELVILAVWLILDRKSADQGQQTPAVQEM